MMIATFLIIYWQNAIVNIFAKHIYKLWQNATNEVQVKKIER